MKKTLIGILLYNSLLGFISCDRTDCKNTNPTFENNLPDSKVYKDELVKQLNNSNQSKLTYWLQKYDEQNGKESLFFYIQGDRLCAILHLTISNWNKLENVRERKGIGTQGAEFTNLKFKIIKNSVSTEFVYQTFDRIID